MKVLTPAILWIWLICVGACGPESDWKSSLVALEGALGTKLPKSAVVLSYVHKKGMDDMWLAKVALSRPDLNNLLKTEPFKSAAWKREMRFLGVGEPWWKPGLLTDSFFAQIRLPGAKVTNVVYGADPSGEQWVIYFQVFET